MVLCAPGSSFAQYKNSTLGFDVGGAWLHRPSIFDSDGTTLLPANRRPLRVNYGVRFSGNAAFKLQEDHWWFITRLDMGFYGHRPTGAANSLERQFDEAMSRELGMVLGLGGSVGIKYVFLTDDVRPYLAMSLGYTHLFPLSQATAASTTFTQLSVGQSSVFDAHVEPGIEIILRRDLALRLFTDLQYWVIFGGPDVRSLVGGIGLTFFY